MPRRNYHCKPIKHTPFQLAGSQNCQAKKSFATQYQAEQAAIQAKQLNPDLQLRAYYCPACQSYHLTTER